MNKTKLSLADRAAAVKAYFDDDPWTAVYLILAVVLAIFTVLYLTVPRTRQAVVTAVGQDCVVVSYKNCTTGTSVVEKVKTEAADKYHIGDTVSIQYKGTEIIHLSDVTL